MYRGHLGGIGREEVSHATRSAGIGRGEVSHVTGSAGIAGDLAGRRSAFVFMATLLNAPGQCDHNTADAQVVQHC